MDVALFMVGGHKLPNACGGIVRLDGTPSGEPDALVVVLGGDEQEVEGIAAGFGVDTHDRAADALFVGYDVERFRSGVSE